MTPDRFDRFLFGPVAATPIALLRTGTGALTALWTSALLGQLDPLLTTMRVEETGPIGWWQFWPDAPGAAIVAMGWLLLAVSLTLTIGLWARSSAVAGFVLLLALRRYNPLAFNGGDLALGVSWLGLAMSNCGAYLSIDSWRRTGQWAGKAPSVSRFGLRYVQLHVSLGYILTFILKLNGEKWPGGTAVWYALNLDDLTRFSVPAWLISAPLVQILTWGTLLVEVAVGIGVWIRRTRPWVLAAGVLLHASIWITFEIGFFSLIMVLTYLAWVPAVEDPRRLWIQIREEGRRLAARFAEIIARGVAQKPPALR